MFVSVDNSQINMNNVEEFLVVQNQNTFQLQVRFVSGAERVLYTGTREYCYQQLGLIMASLAIK